jgi:hypothetical protein
VVNRLARCLNAPGGITIETASARAEDEVKSLAPGAMTELDARLTQLSQTAAREHVALDPLSRADLRFSVCTLALEIQATAGFFARPRLSAAAKMMAEMAEKAAHSRLASNNAFGVFSTALRILFQEELADEAAAEALLAQLRLLTDWSQGP